MGLKYIWKGLCCIDTLLNHKLSEKGLKITTEVASLDAIYVSNGSDTGDVCHLPFTQSHLHSPFTLACFSPSPSGPHLLDMSNRALRCTYWNYSESELKFKECWPKLFCNSLVHIWLNDTVEIDSNIGSQFVWRHRNKQLFLINCI